MGADGAERGETMDRTVARQVIRMARALGSDDETLAKMIATASDPPRLVVECGAGAEVRIWDRPGCRADVIYRDAAGNEVSL